MQFEPLNTAVFKQFAESVQIVTPTGLVQIQGILDDDNTTETIPGNTRVNDRSHVLSVFTTDCVAHNIVLRTEIRVRGKSYKVVGDPEDDTQGVTLLPIRTYE